MSMRRNGAKRNGASVSMFSDIELINKGSKLLGKSKEKSTRMGAFFNEIRLRRVKFGFAK